MKKFSKVLAVVGFIFTVFYGLLMFNVAAPLIEILPFELPYFMTAFLEMNTIHGVLFLFNLELFGVGFVGAVLNYDLFS